MSVAAGDARGRRQSLARGRVTARGRRLAAIPPSRLTLLAAGFCLLSLIGYVLIRQITHPSMIDMLVYRLEGQAAWHGHNLYALSNSPDDLGDTYPPFTALLFVPIGWLSVGAAKLVVTIVNLLLLGLVSYLSVKLVGYPRRQDWRLAAVCTLVGVTVWTEPVLVTLRYGQVNLALAALVLFDLTRRQGSRWQGIGIGLATGLKLTPGLFIVYLALTRRFRAACVAAAVAVGTVGVGWAMTPSGSWRYWTSLLFQTSRVGRPQNTANQSLRGFLSRLLHSGTVNAEWVLLAGVAVVAGLLIAARLHRAGRTAWGACVCAVTALLASPISWSHHWVYCVPILLLLVAEAREAQRRREPSLRWWVAAGLTVVCFGSYALWLVPHVGTDELHQNIGQELLSASYVLFGVAFLVAGYLVARRSPRPDPAVPPTAPGLPAARGVLSMLRRLPTERPAGERAPLR
jgi:alpha-1,2-mannosyltransferase